MMVWTTSVLAVEVQSWQELIDAAKNATGDTLEITLINSIEQPAGDTTFTVRDGIMNVKMTSHGYTRTIKGNGTHQIIRIDSLDESKDKTVEIDGIRFTHGNAFGKYNEASGGALYVSGLAILRNCEFERNEVLSAGGAVRAFAVEIDNCTFSYNTASYGGAISAGTAHISNSLFEHNEAGGRGGALSTGDAYVEDSTFSHNEANLCGAIAASNTMDIKRSKFMYNTSKRNSTVQSNYGTTIEDSIFMKNATETYGAAVGTSYGDAYITRCQFIANASENSDDTARFPARGGAIYHHNSLRPEITQALYITECEFYGNAAFSSGGAGAIWTNVDTTLYGTNYFFDNADGNLLIDEQDYGISVDAGATLTLSDGAQIVAGRKTALIVDEDNSDSPDSDEASFPEQYNGTEVYPYATLIAVEPVPVYDNTWYEDTLQKPSLIDYINVGQPVQIAHRYKDGTWYKIVYDDGNHAGFIEGKYVQQ